ncbi:hypothetical protein [Phaeobacter italicus]|uniref:hypothetical protein n=1 Tax=Phaeobacter italicus TaxID=481446 RepID=UPI00248E1037|nr:hypothetical protein [Phaeobacter italicus]
MKHIILDGNPAGSDYVISDVNGCLSVLTSLLNSVNFSSNDRLFLVGNIIDKGAHSKELIDFTSADNIFPILGSSELIMCMALHPQASRSTSELFMEQWDLHGGQWRHSLAKSELSRLYSIVSNSSIALIVMLLLPSLKFLNFLFEKVSEAINRLMAGTDHSINRV